MFDFLIDILKVDQSTANVNVALLVLRVAIGILMLRHGIPKIKKLISPEPIHFFETFGLSEKNSLKMAAFVEVFFSTCVILGLGTSIAVIPLLFTMIIAAFYTLKSQPFDKKEVPFLFMVVFITLLISGSGKYSLDYILFGFV